MRTRIISAFPGTGKTFFHEQHPDTTLDSDSSQFSWVDPDGNGKRNDDRLTKQRNPDFPQNYIDHIKENIGKYEFIFVSTHKVVRDALLDNCIFFYLIYPDYRKKDAFLERYKARGDESVFVKLLEDNWDTWLKELDFCEFGCKQVRMTYPYIDREIGHIVCSENGDVIEEV